LYEFIVTLRSGLRLTVKADRMVIADQQSLALVLGRPVVGEDPLANAVALFERGQVALVVAREHLVSEEKGEPMPYVIGRDDSGIPF